MLIQHFSTYVKVFAFCSTVLLFTACSQVQEADSDQRDYEFPLEEISVSELQNAYANG